MQKPQDVSLNALRVFLAVAQHNSIKAAASDLNVTPGAISHQIRVLEGALGVKLFTRNNNSIELTETGSKLMQQSVSGLHTLHAALENVTRDAQELRIQASMTFAARWLIPKLDDFKKRNPHVRVRLETSFENGEGPNPETDVTITYYKLHDVPADAIILFEDKCRPYVSPILLSKISDPSDLTSIPALQCSKGNWDWDLWLKDSGLPDIELGFAERFDLDDAALRAAIAGLGMVLTSEFMIQDEIAAGHLCALPHSAEVTLGFYIVHSSIGETSLSRRFVNWLVATSHRPEGGT